jgi:hypothetical protein
VILDQDLIRPEMRLRQLEKADTISTGDDAENDLLQDA